MSFRNERAIKCTRKRHMCNACDKWIEPGEAAINWSGMTDGQFSSIHYHPDCRVAEIALNRLHDWRDYDDWTRLCDADHEDRPWIKAEHPTPYLRMCMTREQYAALSQSTAGEDGATPSSRPCEHPVESRYYIPGVSEAQCGDCGKRILK